MRQCLGCGLCVATALISRQDSGLRVLGQPGFNRSDFAIEQERHDVPPLQVADVRAVTVVATKRPVIDADHFQRNRPQAGSSPYNPRQGVVADPSHQSLCKAGCRAALQRQSKMMNEALQARSAARPFGDDGVIKALGKKLTLALLDHAEEAACDETKVQPTPCAGQIRHLPNITAVNPTDDALHSGHPGSRSSDQAKRPPPSWWSQPMCRMRRRVSFLWSNSRDISLKRA